MSTAVLDAPPIEAPETKTEDQLASETAMMADRIRVKELAGGERKRSVAARLEIGGIIERRMAENVAQFSTSKDGNANVRAQTAKLFALDLTGAFGIPCDDKEVYRMVRAYLMRESLPPEAVANLEALAWDNARVFTRWLQWNPDEEDVKLSFAVDVGVKDDSGRTTRDVDAAPLLATLLDAVAKSPKGASAVRKILDKTEHDALDAELAFLSSKAQTKARAIIQQTQRREAALERSKFFDGLSRRISALGLTDEEIMAELIRTEVVKPSTADLDPASLVDLSEDDAATIGRVLVQAENIDAIAALLTAFEPIVNAAANDKQSARAVANPLSRAINVA